METAKEPGERQVFCSRCLRIAAESLVRVIPCFNSRVGGYVATYRCERCWLTSLEETRTRLAKCKDEAEIASAAMFFERHGIFLHEFRRGDPAPIVRQRLGRMLDLLQTGAIRLSIGPAFPLEAAAGRPPTGGDDG